MDEIIIKTDAAELTKMLSRAVSRGENMKPVMSKISALMLSSIQRNFIAEGRPDKWKPLAEITKSIRKKKGTWPGDILRISQGGLFPSLQAESDDKSARVGSAKIYSAIQNLGGQAGRNKKVAIPKREYMNIPKDEMAEMTETMGNYLTKA